MSRQPLNGIFTRALCEFVFEGLDPVPFESKRGWKAPRPNHDMARCPPLGGPVG